MANLGKWAIGANIAASVGGILRGLAIEKMAQKLIAEATAIMNKASQPMNKQREETSQTIKALAETEITIYNTTMADFIKAIRLFDNRGKIHIQGLSKRKIRKLEREVFKYTKIADKKRLALASGGVAVLEMSVVYGGTQFFGRINGERIINIMDPKSRKDATLRYLGDGSIKKGEFILGGVAITSVGFTLATNFMQEAGNKLEAAKTYLQQAEMKSIEMEKFTETLKSIDEIAIIDIECLKRISNKMDEINKKVMSIYNTNMEISKKRLINIIRSIFGIKPKINISRLKENDIKTIFEYQQCAVLINHIIKLGILKKNGDINTETQKELNKIYSETK